MIIAYAKYSPLIAGSVVYPALQAEPGDTVVISDTTWFVFIDDHFMDEYVHPVRYVFVDNTGNMNVITANSWPVIDGLEVWETSVARYIDALNNGELFFGVENMLFEEEPSPTQDGRGEPDIDFAIIDNLDQLPASMGPNDYGLVCGGSSEPRHGEGADRARNRLGQPPTSVPPGNMYGGNNCSKQDFCDALDSIATKDPVDKLFIVFVGHGGNDDGTDAHNWYLAFGNGDGKLTADEIKEKIKKVKAKRVCVLLYSCYSGCLIPGLKGANDSIEVAASSSKDNTTSSWEYIRYVNRNGVPGYQEGTSDSLIGIRYALHYLDAFLGCIDSSRNWEQTHAWAVAAMDSADSAHNQPTYGKHFKEGAPEGTNNIVIEDATLWLGLPPSAPPQTIEIKLEALDLVGAGQLPLVARTLAGGAFPLFAPPPDPQLGFNPLLGPPIFDGVFANPMDLNGISPDAWMYQFQSPTPPHLNPGLYLLADIPLVGLQPNPGLFFIDTIFNPPGLIPQMFDPTPAPIPFVYIGGSFEVMPIPNQPPVPQQLILTFPPDPFATGYTFTLTGFDAELDPFIFSPLLLPPGGLLLPGPGPLDATFTMPVPPEMAGLELALQAVVLPDGGGKSVSQAAEYNVIEFRWTVPSLGGCACDCHADPANCEGTLNILDVVEAVNVAFRGGSPIPDPNVNCPVATTDVDCSLATDVLDIVRIVNVAFRGESAVTEFCNPCP